MQKIIIELPDGTRIGSGADAVYAIKSHTITECVNNGTELTLGSTCCACLEAQIIAKDQKLGLPAGQLIKLYKADASGAETKAGTFRLEAPAKKSDNVHKITAYDRISDLDKDLSDWLKNLTGWPYSLITFAGMVCKACGLTLATTNIPNGSFPVRKFYKAGVTGRRLMEWICEIACRFCRANADGNIELEWYADSGVTIQATGDRYYFSGALTYEDYEVAAIDAVKLRLADSDSGALWPSGDADNPYIITGNPLLLAKVTTNLVPYLDTIQSQLAALPAYKPCKVSLPASLDIQAGHTVQIVDKHGNRFTTCVMTKTQTGQRDTLECTGSARRDSSTASNNRSAAQMVADQEAYAQNAAQQAVEGQSWESLFNNWTNNGSIQGIFAQDNVWIFNAAVAKITNLVADAIQSGTLDAAKVTIKNLIADLITAGTLKSADGKTYFDLDSAVFRSIGDSTITEIGNGTIRVLNADEKPIIALLAENSGGRLILYDGNAYPAFEVKVWNKRTSMSIWNYDSQSVAGGFVGFKEINGNNVLVMDGL